MNTFVVRVKRVELFVSVIMVYFVFEYLQQKEVISDNIFTIEVQSQLKM